MRWSKVATVLLGLLAAAPSYAQTKLSEEAKRSFVSSNAVFILMHELGHAAISEFNLPVLGREEDAADSFAALAMLFIGTDEAWQTLIDAAAGLYAIGARETRDGRAPAFYGEHGLDKQRAMQIVCLMVGAQPDRGGDVALAGHLPADRRESCIADYEQAEASWLRLLRRHLRAPGRPSFVERLMQLGARSSAPIEVIYEDASPPLSEHREALKNARALERVRDFARDNFAFPRPLSIEARACGRADASWDPNARKLEFCYELMSELAGLADDERR